MYVCRYKYTHCVYCVLHIYLTTHPSQIQPLLFSLLSATEVALMVIDLKNCIN